jgi:hypothetical protein
MLSSTIRIGALFSQGQAILLSFYSIAKSGSEPYLLNKLGVYGGERLIKLSSKYLLSSVY